MELEPKKLEEFTEFECKYPTKEEHQIQFKRIAESLDDLKHFVYAQGPDRYYKPVRGIKARFARYRKADHEKKPIEWLTLKQKLTDKGSYKRKEPNWIVTGTPLSEIEAGLEMIGFKFHFKIYKYCHIYNYPDATLVYYTVINPKNEVEHFIEIELNEKTISEKTEEEAWDVIRKYEAALKPLGITYKNRKRKSLYDMYNELI